MRFYMADFLARYKVLLQLDTILEKVHNKTARWYKPYIRSSLDPEYLDKIISSIGATTEDGVDDDYFSDEASLFDSDDSPAHAITVSPDPDDSPSTELIELTRTPSPFGPEVNQKIFEPTKNVVYVEDLRPRYVSADASQVKPKPKPQNDFETLFRSTSDGKPRMSAATIWKLIHKDPRRRKSQPEAGPSMSILDAIMDMESDEKYHDALTFVALGGDMADKFAR